MPCRATFGALLALCLAACGGSRDVATAGGAADGGADAPRAAVPASVLRLSKDGGTARLYAAASLEPRDWEPEEKLPALRALVGLDLDQHVAYALDAKRNVIGLDLESGRSRPYAAGARQTAVGPDGAVYAVDSSRVVTRVQRRQSVRFRERVDGQPAALYGAMNGDLLAIVAAGDSAGLEVLDATTDSRRIPLPAGPTSATYWGDLVAVGTGDGIVLADPQGKNERTRVDVDAPVAALAFSPSGHRVYALPEGEAALLVVDRFGHDVLGRIGLPGPGRTLRVGRYGSWLLVRAAGADSVYVVDIPHQRVTGALASTWDADLPAIAGPDRVLVRRGKDVAALDLGAEGFPARGRVEGGAADLWLPVEWAPAGPEADTTAVLATVDSATPETSGRNVPSTGEEGDVGADSAAAPVAATATTPGGRAYLQISSSQNGDWARQLAGQMKGAGLPASVLVPREEGDPFRVVLGPYGSREEAEAVGRQLGRPSFVITTQDSVAQ